MGKVRVLVPIGSRSDEGLSKPIIKRLQADDYFDVHTIKLSSDYRLDYDYTDNVLANAFDIIICVGDRMEMFAASLAAFFRNIPIVHVYAGIINKGWPTKDEVYRHCISLMSELQFCESYEAENILFHFFNPLGKIPNAHVVGITHLDDLEIDETLVPRGKLIIKWYNLILYNPILDIDIMKWEIERIKALANFGTNYNIIIGSNPDPWFDSEEFYKEKMKDNTIFYDNLPRSQFLGLLKNCQKFITNSSSALYEAPYFLKDEQIINIGVRNTKRTPIDITNTGASDKILKIIKEYWRNRNEKQNTVP